jgi:undecaprenyl-phosphate 4-deoxy-4-formamido-L-arabinose transferase
MDKFSVIIPVYNEEKIIVKNTKRLVKFLNKLRTPYEIVVCDNGSSDRTAEKGEMLQRRFPKKVRFVKVPERGVGSAFKKAVRSASYNNLISIDMDLAVELDFIPKCLSLLKDASIVVGSKISSQERPFYRRLMSKVYIILTKLLLGLDFSDYSIGAKSYRKNDIIGSISRIDRGSFYVIELIYFAKQRNKKIVEVRTSCRDTRKSRFSLRNEVLYRLKKLLILWFREKIAKKIIKIPK